MYKHEHNAYFLIALIVALNALYPTYHLPLRCLQSFTFINHSYSSSSPKTTDTIVLLDIFLMQLPKLVAKLGISKEEIPTQQGLKQLLFGGVSLIHICRKIGDPISSHAFVGN